MRRILTCSCHNMDTKAKSSFALLFPEDDVPDIIRGRDRIYKWGKELQNEHIIAISKLSGKYAYYIELEDGKIIKEYDLIRGSRIA